MMPMITPMIEFETKKCLHTAKARLRKFGLSKFVCGEARETYFEITFLSTLFALD